MPIVGIIENMKNDNARAVQVETEKLGLTYLGAISFDLSVEKAIGNESLLLKTAIANVLRKVSEQMLLKMSE